MLSANPPMLRAEVTTGAEEAFFGEIPTVMSTGFFKMDAKKAPGTVLSVSETDIENSPIRDLRDLVDQRVPSGVMSGHENHGSIYGTRGILIDNSAKTPLLLDGQNITQRAHFGPSAEFALPLLGDIKSVEITQGPCAIVHGSGAIDGFINLVPKNGENSPGLLTKAEYGVREHLYKAETGYGMKYGDNKNLYLYGGWVTAEGFHPKADYGFFNSNQPAGQWSYDQANQRTTLSQGFLPSYKLASYWTHDNASVNALYQVTRQSMDSYARPQTADMATWNQYKLALRPRYTFDFGEKNSLVVTASGEAQDYFTQASNTELSLAQESDYSHPPRAGGSETHLQGDVLYKSTTFDMQSIAVGALFGQRAFRNQKLFFSSPKPGDDDESLNAKWDESAVYAEDIIQPTEKFTASLGARFDSVDYHYVWSPKAASRPPTKPASQSHTSPRVALSYALTPDDTIKASYQQGFRTADVTYWRWWLAFDQIQTNAGLKGLPDLKPETVDSYELNYRKELSEKKYAFDTSIYYNEYKNALLWHGFSSGDGFLSPAGLAANNAAAGWPGGSFLNTHGVFASVGGELAAEIKATSNIKGRASYAYSRPEGIGAAEAASGWTTANHRHRWLSFPTHIVKLSITGDWLDKKLTTEVNGQYYDAVSGANSEVTTPPVDVYGTPRFIVNASVRYAFTKSLSVRLIGENLGSNAVPPVGSSPSRPWGGSVGYSDRRGYLEGVYKF